MSNGVYLGIGFVTWIILYNGLGLSIVLALVLEVVILTVLKLIFGVKE